MLTFLKNIFDKNNDSVKESPDNKGDLQLTNKEPKESSSNEPIVETTFVVGLNYENRLRTLNKLVKELKEYDEYYKPYDGMTNKEILESYSRVYEIDLIPFNDIKLEKEDDNPYDKNAIKVLIADQSNEFHHLGYIPKEKCIKVRSLLDKNDVQITAYVRGGKYKEVDIDDYGNDKVKVFNSNYGINITIECK